MLKQEILCQLAAVTGYHWPHQYHGVTTSADAASNVDIDNEAVLILDPESEIQDSFNSDGEGLSGDFIVSPDGASYNITGLQAKNNYIIEMALF